MAEQFDLSQSSDELKKITELLGNKLNASDLQSLLIKISAIRAEELNAQTPFRNFHSSRFSRPSDISQRIFNRLDSLAYELLPGSYETIELSPVTPFASVSSISNLSQNLVLSTIRNYEVVSDPTNVMALESAIRRKSLIKKQDKSAHIVNLCSSHRLLRAQAFENEKFTAHFRVFSLVSAGKDTGNLEFESNQMAEHLNFYLSLSAELSLLDRVEVFISDFSKSVPTSFLDDLKSRLKAEFQGLPVKWDNNREQAKNYYSPLAFMIRYRDDNRQPWLIVDGGFTDWTRQLLSNKKERFLGSAIGTELLLRVFPGIQEKLSR